MLSPYVITGSEHNGDALPKNCKVLSSIPKICNGKYKEHNYLNLQAHFEK